MERAGCRCKRQVPAGIVMQKQLNTLSVYFIWVKQHGK
jgi:hypothetical protein